MLKQPKIKHVISPAQKHHDVRDSESPLHFGKSAKLSPNNKDISFALHKSVDSLKKSVTKDYRHIREHLNVFRPIGSLIASDFEPCEESLTELVRVIEEEMPP